MSTYRRLDMMSTQNNAVAAGLYIRRLREHNKLEQIRLAQELKIDVRTLGRWERGENRPGIDTLQILLDKVGGSIEEFSRLWDIKPGTPEDTDKAIERTLGSSAAAIDRVADEYARALSPDELAQVIDLAQRLSEEDRRQWLDIGRRLRRDGQRDA